MKPLVTAGPSGHRIYRFDKAEVSEFARRFTTDIRIANGLEVQCKEVVSRLKKDRIQPVLARHEIGLDLYRTADLPASYFPSQKLNQRPLDPHDRSSSRPLGGFFRLEMPRPRSNCTRHGARCDRITEKHGVFWNGLVMAAECPSSPPVSFS